MDLHGKLYVLCASAFPNVRQEFLAKYAVMESIYKTFKLCVSSYLTVNTCKISIISINSWNYFNEPELIFIICLAD